MNNRERLLELIKEKAVIHREIKLSSGKKSNYYIDCRKITLDPEGAYLVAEVLFEALRDDIDAVGGLTLGADPICGAYTAASYMNKKPVPAFIVRKELKEHGTMKKIEGNLEEGSKVAIVDDVATTGGSLLKAINAVEEQNCVVKRVIVLVDREEGARENLAKQGHKLETLYTKKELGV